MPHLNASVATCLIALGTLLSAQGMSATDAYRVRNMLGEAYNVVKKNYDDAKFHGLLDNPLELVGGDPGLYQRHSKRRLALNRIEVFRHRPRARTFDAQVTAELSSAPVEHRDRGAFTQSQHAHRVVRDLGRQGSLRIRNEVGVDVEAGKRHESKLKATANSGCD